MSTTADYQAIPVADIEVLRQAFAQSDRNVVALQRVADLHYAVARPSDWRAFLLPPSCAECGQSMPCRTVTAMAEAAG